jgi:hypothetical protein
MERMCTSRNDVQGPWNAGLRYSIFGDVAREYGAGKRKRSSRSTTLRADAHLSDDKTVAKMGHPVSCWTESGAVFCGLLCRKKLQLMRAR